MCPSPFDLEFDFNFFGSFNAPMRIVGRVQTSNDDDDECFWGSLTSIEEMIENESKIFDRKLDEFTTLHFEKIKDSNTTSSSHGTSSF